MALFRTLIKLFSSLRLAVILLLTISVLICWGTLVESRYDSLAAKVFVYNSWWMKISLALLVLSLLAVIVDRFPWKRKHLAFICAHIGVVLLIVGAWLTQSRGIDGTVRLLPGQEVASVAVSDTELVLYRSGTGDDFVKVYQDDVEFLGNPVRENRPFLIKTSDLRIEILESVPYAVPRMSVESSEFAQSGAGVRFQMTNERIQSLEWLVQKNAFDRINYDMGPVKISMGGLWERELERHEIRLVPDQNGVRYQVYQQSEIRPVNQGLLLEGGSFETPWMGLQFRMLRYYPKAQVKWDLDRFSRPTPKTSSALRVRHGGEESWLFVNDYLKIFTDQHVYLLAYSQKRVDLGFPILLQKFEKTNYPGSMRAMAYQSQVVYGDGREALISMNEPLKYNGFYLYQAGFDDLPGGRVQASILSVNHDPGRLLKYLGSLVMCLGIVLLFYFRKHYRRQN